MKADKLNKFISFFYSFLSGLKINLVGKLATGDLIAVLYAVFSIPKWNEYYRKVPDIKKIHYALAVFLFFQVISDIYNESSFTNSIRGLSNIAMAALVIMYLTQLLLNNFSVLPLIFFGFSLSPLIFGFNIQVPYKVSLEDEYFLKLGVIPILNGFLFGTILFLNTRKNIIINATHIAFIFIFYGVFCFLFDARSNGIFLILSAIVILNKSYFKYLTFRNILWILPICLILFQSLYFVYVEGVLTGAIKSEQTKKQLSWVSNPYNPFSLLSVGRIEIFSAIAAIEDKPLLGHGSWAKDIGGKYNLVLAKKSPQSKRYLNKVLHREGDKNLIIPTHSILTGAWVAGGFFAFLSVLYILFVYVKMVVLLFKIDSFINSSFFPLITYFFINLIWVFLFSPLQELKSVVPLPLVLTIVLFEKYKSIIYIKPQKE
jgi:hypothetical protein